MLLPKFLSRKKLSRKCRSILASKIRPATGVRRPIWRDATHLTHLTLSFFDGYCSTVQGLLYWFEVDLGFTELAKLTHPTHPTHPIKFICDQTSDTSRLISGRRSGMWDCER